MSDYLQIVKHYEECFDTHGDCSKGVDWPNQEDALTRYKTMLEVMSLRPCDNYTLLDFGCGLSHLYSYMQENSFGGNYSGCDLSEKFVQASKSKWPDNDYYSIDILEDDSGLPNFDYIIANGVFTEKRELSYDAMFDYMKSMVAKLYNHCNVGLSFNVMSKIVDWERDDLFHVPMDQMGAFLCKEVTRNFVFRNDYGLYEYTVYVYR